MLPLVTIDFLKMREHELVPKFIGCSSIERNAYRLQGRDFFIHRRFDKIKLQPSRIYWN